MVPDLILNVHVRAVPTEDGQFTPYITVVRQQARRWSHVYFDLEKEDKFATAVDAIEFGKKLAIVSLQKRYPQAHFKVTESIGDRQKFSGPEQSSS